MGGLRAGALLALILTVLGGSACSGPTSQSVQSPASAPSATSPRASPPRASPSPAGSPIVKLGAAVPMPTGFPSDFPIYPGARLTKAANFPAGGSTIWGMEWQTVDRPSKVQTFFIGRLNAGDWVLLTSSGTADTPFSATFTRASDLRVTGTLRVAASATVTKISLLLTIPL
jgi:hypothetical protein